MAKILSTNLLAYNGHKSEYNLNKIAGVPKKISYTIIQHSSDEGRLGDIITSGTRVYSKNMSWGDYIPELPSSYGNFIVDSQWIVQDDDTGGYALGINYHHSSVPTFTFIESGNGDAIKQEIEDKLGVHGRPLVMDPSAQYKYVLEGSDGMWYVGCTVTDFTVGRPGVITPYAISVNPGDLSTNIVQDDTSIMRDYIISNNIPNFYEVVFSQGSYDSYFNEVGLTLQTLGEELFTVISSN